jgi:hypothetical protein
MPLIGDTVRLKVEFKDYDGNYIDPTSVKLNIYEEKTKKLLTTTPIALDSTNKQDTGIYFYDYTIPQGLTTLVYEFTGIYNTKAITARAILTREWVKQ